MSPDKRDALASREVNSVIKEKSDIGYSQTFMSNKGEQYYRVRYESEFSKFLSSSKSELSKIHEEYPDDYVERDVSAQDKMWRSVMHLQRVIFGKAENGDQWSEYRRNKLLEDLHENFFQLATKRFISRPNFECCLLKASRGSRHRTVKDEKLVIALDSVYNSFDVLSNEAFDWRRFLFYLHFALDPRKTAKEHLLSAFSKIGNKSCIDLQDLGVVLFPLVKADAAKDVLCVMDEAWAQVKASQQGIDENLGSTKLTMNFFQQMLELKGIQTSFFDQSKSAWGRGRTFPVYICQWEEEFYNETLLQLVKVSRREATIEDKLNRDNSRTKLNVWRQLLDFARYQRSLRSIFNKINDRMKLRRKARGLMAFSHWTANQHAALEIQRVGRGFLGRMIARNRWMIYSSATMIQTHSRMYVAKRKLNELSSHYNWAIVEMQRNIRGALGRRLALRKLLTLVEQAHLNNVKERERLEMERGVWCLTKLQSFWRRKKATAISFELRQKMQREIHVRRAMETERNLFLRERQIYERQLEEFYKSMKEEHDTSKQNQSKITQDQIKVRTLRRHLKNEELLNAKPDNSECLATEKWKSDWEAKIESDVKGMKSHSIHCLEQPENSVEKQTRANIRKRVKGRVPQVLARAKERGIPMETKEAKHIAREEIIHIIGEEERARLRSEMDKAFLERERLKGDARLQSEAKEKDAHSRATIYAVSLVAMACRKWRARKELRRLCLETYEKKFDEWNHAFFYRNIITGDISWTKPKAMGLFEIPAKDEWKLLRDAHNFPYYFNPCSMEMRWIPPASRDMCCGTVHHTWWREYPVRIGQCPNFGDSELNEYDGKWYCEECSPSYSRNT
mmetsp:Transcript_11934/g.22103  ORF Transcript_11934/g.22103 Transcript_11934/m.22103 type:complete len:851 (-) Transcript_11934:47-2599(-)